VEYLVFLGGAIIMGAFCFWALYDAGKDAETRKAHPERASIVGSEHESFGPGGHHH
jgi:hypothetical protein